MISDLDRIKKNHNKNADSYVEFGWNAFNVLSRFDGRLSVHKIRQAVIGHDTILIGTVNSAEEAMNLIEKTR